MTFIIVLIVLFAIVLFASVRVLNEYERGVVFTLGRFSGTKGPGLVVVWPVVQQMRKKIDGVSKLFTLDACRHGGMTELEEAELTDGQGRALSGHKTAQAYRGYAKETMMRALAATRKRHAHLLAQKELDQQNADGAASPQDERQQTSPMSKTGVRSQR